MMRLAPFMIVLSALACACNNDKDDKTSDTNDGGGFWAVGEDATMVRLTHEGDVSFYPLEAEGDLLAIACRGEDIALAVGEDGLLVRTGDAGRTWTPVAGGEGSRLSAVAMSGGTAAFVAGPGVLLRSDDVGETFAAVPGADLEWTAVTTTASGAAAWLTSADGDIYRLGDDLERVYDGDAALAGIAATPDGAALVAVGGEGLVLRSDDVGATWARVDVPTVRDLHAVRISADGSRVVAVGQAGAVVQIDGGLAGAEELLDGALSLRALHLGGDGHGHAVGDHGVVFSTHDAGVRWEPVDLGLEQALFGLDDLHGEPHL